MEKHKLECPMCGKRFKAYLDGWDKPFGKHRAQCPNKECEQPHIGITYEASPWAGWKKMRDFIYNIKCLFSFPFVLNPFKIKDNQKSKADIGSAIQDAINEELLVKAPTKVHEHPRSGLVPRYVLGAPRQEIPLRPLRSCLFDEEIIDVSPGEEWRRDLFVNRMRFKNGEIKSEFNCNMPQDGMLGSPSEFDLCYLDVSFPSQSLTGRDVIFLAQNIKLQWIFGQTNIWLDVPVSEGEKILIQNTERNEKKGYLDPAWIDTEISAGIVFRFDMTNDKNMPRRIFSMESFRAILRGSGFSKKYPRFRVRVTMQGIQFASL